SAFLHRGRGPHHRRPGRRDAVRQIAGAAGRLCHQQGRRPDPPGARRAGSVDLSPFCGERLHQLRRLSRPGGIEAVNYWRNHIRKRARLESGTMTTPLESLRHALPDYARDIKLNLGTLLGTEGTAELSKAQKWG